MAFIKLTEASVDFPIFDGKSRSLKNKVFELAKGGVIGRNSSGVVTVRGLDQINLEINQGERVGIIGHNGAGKTTLLRLLTGVYSPTSGTSQVLGSRYSLINPTLGIDPDATGRENIRLRTAMMGLSRSDFLEVQQEIVDFTELGEFIDLPFRTYSSGMQMRLAFAISTIIQTDILIMDEWLATGDEEFRERASQRLEQMLNATKIFVLASHSYNLLAVNCDRFIWLEHGKIRMDGNRSEVLDVYFKRSLPVPAAVPAPHNGTAS